MHATEIASEGSLTVGILFIRVRYACSCLSFKGFYIPVTLLSKHGRDSKKKLKQPSVEQTWPKLNTGKLGSPRCDG